MAECEWGYSICVLDAAGNIKSLEAIEAEAIVLALLRNRGDKSAAARALGIGRTTLYRKLAEW